MYQESSRSESIKRLLWNVFILFFAGGFILGTYVFTEQQTQECIETTIEKEN